MTWILWLLLIIYELCFVIRLIKDYKSPIDLFLICGMVLLILMSIIYMLALLKG